MTMFKSNIINKSVKALAAMVCLAFAACQSDVIPVTDKPAVNNSLTLTGSVTIPSMNMAQTRGEFADTPGEGLQLSIVEFRCTNDENDPADEWLIKKVYKAATKTVTNVENGKTVTFTVTLDPTEAPTHLHLMIAGDYISNVEYGSEATVLPFITVSNNEEAYWGMVSFPDGLTETTEKIGENNEIITEVTLLQEVIENMQNVPVIRNFAAITVTDAEKTDNFQLYDFEIVHVPDQGTIAPVNPDIDNPSIPGLLNGREMKSYDEITAVYSGVTPTTASFSNKATDDNIANWVPKKNYASTSVGPVYMYEHPYESTRRTYLIIYGNYTGGGLNQRGYYKVDIGKKNISTGGFDYYNIIRNINYNVKITSVLAPGAATPSEAISRAPFNNISASVETSSMLNVSNGTNLLAVNATSHIIVTEDQKIDILYRYVKNVTSAKPEQDNRVPQFICKPEKNGPVVKSYTEVADSIDKNKMHWKHIIITPQPPTDQVKEQQVYIVDPDGLGRTINLTLRKPWQYAQLTAGSGSLITVKRGSKNIYEFTPQTVLPDNVSNSAGGAFTVYFNLPDGLPESMFPLDFKLEALKQGIENNKIGTLTVSTGPSLFDPKNIAISYIKTVSYSEYRYQYINDDSNAVDIGKPNTHHTVRCRFTTISQVTAGDEGTIRVHNPYFTPDINVTFTRTNVTN